MTHAKLNSMLASVLINRFLRKETGFFKNLSFRLLKVFQRTFKVDAKFTYRTLFLALLFLIQRDDRKSPEINCANERSVLAWFS